MASIRGLTLAIYGLLLVTCTRSAESDSASRRDPSLVKRARSFNCQDNTIPGMPGAAGVHPNIALIRQQFSTLTSLCTSWPAGFGLACREDGSKYALQPNSMLAASANMNPVHPQMQWARFLWLRCLQTCHCENIAPDEPQPAPVARPACVAEEEPEPASLPQGAASSRITTRPGNECPATPRDRLSFFHQRSCSDWYGYPILADCREVVISLHQYLLAHINHISQEDYENFPNHSDLAEDDFNFDLPQEIVFALANRLAYLTRKYPTVQFIDLPLTIKKDACTISILQQDVPNDGFKTEGAPEDDVIRATTAVIDQCVVLHGKGGWAAAGVQSRIESLSYDGEEGPYPLGIFVYHPKSDFKKLLDLKYACNVDAEGKLICQDTDENEPPRKKPKPDNSSPWGAGVGDPGQGSSSQLPSAPVSHSVQQCGGRCWHPDDCGASDCRCSHTNAAPTDGTEAIFACHYLPDLQHNIAVTKPLATLCTHGRCLLANTTNDNTMYNNVTLEILSRPNATIPDGTIECPCNCTYVSPACCLSTNGILWELPIAKSDTIMQAPNSNSCCDTTTGKWKNTTMLGVSPNGNTACPR